MNKHIFIINGSGGVGKDTFVSLVTVQMSNETSCVPATINYSSVDKIKEMAKMVGWNGGKSEKDRKFLSDLKFLCSEYNDIPFRSLEETVDVFNKSDSLILFLHIREPKEIERAVDTFGAKTILIKRDAVRPITSNAADGNVLNYDYDIVIENNGTLADLEQTVIQFVARYCT